MVVSGDATRVLARAECDGHAVRLPGEQLERKLYMEVNEVLSRLGGEWKSGKVRAHVFDEDPAPLLAVVVETGEMPPKNPMAFFPTPAPVVARMMEIVQEAVARARRALEPSAGEGDIASRLARDLTSGATLDVVELDPRRAAKLRAAGFHAHEIDFLMFAGDGYDVVAMNPPFTAPGDPLAYIAHIRHAHSLLAPGGELVSVAPNNFPTRSDRRCTAFREFVQAHGSWEELPRDAFKESGTGTACVLVHLTA
jgi:SAM-dependent methyltransferase